MGGCGKAVTTPEGTEVLLGAQPCSAPVPVISLPPPNSPPGGCAAETLSPSMAQVPRAVGTGGRETCSGIQNFIVFIKVTPSVHCILYDIPFRAWAACSELHYYFWQTVWTFTARGVNRNCKSPHVSSGQVSLPSFGNNLFCFVSEVFWISNC